MSETSWSSWRHGENAEGLARRPGLIRSLRSAGATLFEWFRSPIRDTVQRSTIRRSQRAVACQCSRTPGSRCQTQRRSARLRLIDRVGEAGTPVRLRMNCGNSVAEPVPKWTGPPVQTKRRRETSAASSLAGGRFAGLATDGPGRRRGGIVHGEDAIRKSGEARPVTTGGGFGLEEGPADGLHVLDGQRGSRRGVEVRAHVGRGGRADDRTTGEVGTGQREQHCSTARRWRTRRASRVRTA